MSVAFISKIEADDRTIRGFHPTSVACRYSAAIISGMKVVQLTTYGSEDRVVTGQPSQTLQFTEETAIQLVRILRKEFGLKD